MESTYSYNQTQSGGQSVGYVRRCAKTLCKLFFNGKKEARPASKKRKSRNERRLAALPRVLDPEKQGEITIPELYALYSKERVMRNKHLAVAICCMVGRGEKGATRYQTNNEQIIFY